MKTFSEEWEKIHSTEEWGRYPSEPVIRFVARNYYKTDRKQVKMLDFGCGAGANTWYLAREGFDVYAFDGSESAVRKAKEYLQKDGFSNVHFSVMDAGNLDYENDFFDCIIDNVCVYANLSDGIKKMYADIYSMLKCKGKLFTSVFGMNTDSCGTGVCIEENTYKDMETGALQGRAIAHFFTKEELRNTLEEAGFKNIMIDEMTYTDKGSVIELFFAIAEK